MKINPRDRLVNQAECDLERVIWHWLDKFDLTTAEELLIINDVLLGVTRATLRAIIREERERSTSGD
jgi:hypothetical protein